MPVLDLGAGSFEAAVEQLRTLYPDPTSRMVLVLDVPASATPLQALVDRVVPADQSVPAPPAPHVLADLAGRLLGATAPGGALDPQVLGSDVPWSALVARLLGGAPALARQVAETWVKQLDHTSMVDGCVPHAVVAAVGGYSMAAAEEALGRPMQARRWAREAHAHVEHEETAGIALAAYVRAAALLGRGRTLKARTVRLPFSGSSPCLEPLTQ